VVAVALGIGVAGTTDARAADAAHAVGSGSAHIRMAPSIAVDPGDAKTFSVAFSEQPSSGLPFRPRVATTLNDADTWPVVSTLPVPAHQQFINDTSLASLGNGRLVATYLVVGSYTFNGSARDLNSVVVTHSADYGRTWSAPAYLFHAQSNASGVCSATDSTRTDDVDVAADPRPTLHRAYITWLSDDSCLGKPTRYHLARTNDSGATWSKGAVWEPDPFADAANTSVLQLFPAHVAVGPAGYVYAGYTGVYSDPGFCPPKAGGIVFTSVMARSPDGGRTVQSGLMMRSCGGFGVPRTVINPSTRALVAVLDNGSRVRVMRSTDAGLHWNEAQVTQPVSGKFASASVAPTPGGDIALVGVTGITCKPELIRSANDGTTWAAPVQLSTNVTALCPQDTHTAVAAGPNNVLHAVWAERAPLSNGGAALWTAEMQAAPQ
jgi:hypothetical protein